MLNAQMMAMLMLASWPFPPILTASPNILDEFNAYAEGIVEGLKLATVQGMSTGFQVQPGTPSGNGIAMGIINPGPIVLAGLMQVNSIGILPPLFGGMPMPAQMLYFLALGQAATHLFLAQIDFSGAMDQVALGTVMVTPGMIQVNGPLVGQLILKAMVQKGFPTTPMRVGLCNAMGLSIQQFLLLGSASGGIFGGAPLLVSGAPVPMVGVRMGKIT